MKSKSQATTLPQYLSMLRRMIVAAGERVGRADAEDLAELIALRADLDRAIEVAVKLLRADGWTWQSIGDATGTSKQAAIKKWASSCSLL